MCPWLQFLAKTKGVCPNWGQREGLQDGMGGKAFWRPKGRGGCCWEGEHRMGPEDYADVPKCMAKRGREIQCLASMLTFWSQSKLWALPSLVSPLDKSGQMFCYMQSKEP